MIHRCKLLIDSFNEELTGFKGLVVSSLCNSISTTGFGHLAVVFGMMANG